MSAPRLRKLFRLTFHQNGQVYELYARKVGSGELPGCLSVEELVFGSRSSLVVDPSEEKLKAEFDGVSRLHLPLHLLLRVDEVRQEGPARIVGETAKVLSFPGVGGPEKRA